ncbi:MAG: hypothetical protein O2960_13255 [Verrucomicrobia bacterium]|nr:hypothetical protein [Verrucomicrobiota bacterium]
MIGSVFRIRLEELYGRVVALNPTLTDVSNLCNSGDADQFGARSTLVLWVTVDKKHEKSD